MENICYQIQIIESFSKDKFEKIKNNKPFFHTFLAQNLEIYTNKENQKYTKDTILVYKIFNIAIICIKNSISVSSEYCKFHKHAIKHTAIYTNNNIKDEQISEYLRGSSTLKIDKDNCYNNPDIKVVFSEKGFLLQDNYTNQISKFEDMLSMFILSLAYREKIEYFLNLTSNIIENKSYNKIIDLKKDFYHFNLKYFFNNPIHYNYQQKHTIWKLLFKYYDISQIHREVKTQIEDLVDILYTEQKEQQKIEEEIKETKQKRIEFTLIVLGFIITLASLISTYKDLREILQ